MNTAASSTSTLDQLLREELGAMTTLAKVILAEQTSLIDNNPEKLATITQEKNDLISQITRFEKNRNTLLTQLGFTPNADGMAEYLSTLAADSHSKNYWDNLLIVSAGARENNRTNGILINRQLSRNQSALGILQNNGQAGAMYGADGQAKNATTAGRGIVAG